MPPDDLQKAINRAIEPMNAFAKAINGLAGSFSAIVKLAEHLNPDDFYKYANPITGQEELLVGSEAHRRLVERFGPTGLPAGDDLPPSGDIESLREWLRREK